MPSRRSPVRNLFPTRSHRQESCLVAFFIPLLVVITLGIVAVVASGGIGSADTSTNPSFGAASPSPGAIAPFFAAPVQYWSGSIESWAKDWHIDANLIATVMQIESCGDPLANSRAGAKGLFQVMPFHFKAGENPVDVETNAQRGLEYLNRCLVSAQGDTRQALAGYNGGISLIGQDESNWPAETSQYVYWGTGIYQEAVQKARQSVFLKTWLAQGGNRLCQQASQRLKIHP